MDMRVLMMLAAVSMTQVAVAVPLTMSHQGRLLDSVGVPVNGTHSVSVSLYEDGTSSTPVLWTETHGTVVFSDGYFGLELGSVTPLSVGILDGSTRFLGFTVGTGDPLLPRTALVAVPYALRAAVADNAADLSILDGITRLCPNGASQTFDGSTSTWSVCPSTWNCTDTPSHVGCQGAPASSDFASCLAIRDSLGFDGIEDAPYWIDPDGAGVGDAPFLAFCGMSFAGGGWTLVMNVDTGDGHYVHFENLDFWTSTNGFGSLSNHHSTDYKSAVAFRDVAGSEFLVEAHTESIQLAWRSWSLSTPRTMLQITTLSANSVFTAGSTLSSGTESLSQYEAVVRPIGELEANARYGVTSSYDESRILNTGAAGHSSASDGNDTVMGIGCVMNVNNGTHGSKWDAGYGWHGTGYSVALIGSDELAGDPWPDDPTQLSRQKWRTFV